MEQLRSNCALEIAFQRLQIPQKRCAKVLALHFVTQMKPRVLDPSSSVDLGDKLKRPQTQRQLAGRTMISKTSTRPSKSFFPRHFKNNTDHLQKPEATEIELAESTYVQEQETHTVSP